jgi:hypothetical protein
MSSRETQEIKATNLLGFSFRPLAITKTHAVVVADPTERPAGMISIQSSNVDEFCLSCVRATVDKIGIVADTKLSHQNLPVLRMMRPAPREPTARAMEFGTR